jgi:transcriptional regulator with XRE-family HTH domain
VTQRKLAAEIGRDFTTVSQYETGRCAPSVGTLATIASALGVRLDDLVRVAA